MNLHNEVAVLTGAASGIGRATALALAQRGCHLALADIDTAGLAETAAAAAAHGVTVSQHVLDVASRDAVAALPAAVLAVHGRVSLLINNAGVAVGGTVRPGGRGRFRLADGHQLPRPGAHDTRLSARAAPATGGAHRQHQQRLRPDRPTGADRLCIGQVRGARLQQRAAA